MEETATKSLFLTAEELEQMGFPRNHVNRMLNAKDMPVVHSGKTRMMHRALFMEKVAECARTGANLLPPVARKKKPQPPKRPARP